MVYSILLLVLGLIGLGVSFYILQHKRSNKAFVCIPGQDCNTVLHSTYNNVFGIPNEVMGLLYYGFAIVGAILQLLAIEPFGFITVFNALFVGGTVALLFSLYFIYIMGWVLKEWCPYCLVSAFASTGIFIVEVISYFTDKI